MSNPTQFADMNAAKNYDFIRRDPKFRNEHDEVCRNVKVQPLDENDPAEERSWLIVSGVARIGFDPRTHKAWIKEGEVVISPLNK